MRPSRVTTGAVPSGGHGTPEESWRCRKSAVPHERHQNDSIGRGLTFNPVCRRNCSTIRWRAAIWRRRDEDYAADPCAGVRKLRVRGTNWLLELPPSCEAVRRCPMRIEIDAGTNSRARPASAAISDHSGDGPPLPPEQQQLQGCCSSRRRHHRDIRKHAGATGSMSACGTERGYGLLIRRQLASVFDPESTRTSAEAACRPPALSARARQTRRRAQLDIAPTDVDRDRLI